MKDLFLSSMQDRPPEPSERSEILDAVRRGVLVGAAALVFVVPAVLYHKHHPWPAHTGAAAVVPHAAPGKHLGHLAKLGDEPASADVRRVANWVADSGDNQAMNYAVVDKVAAKVFLFDPQGRLLAAAPALLGSAHGDDTVPGIGEKPIKDVLPDEKTTPAGRFVAEVGESSSRGEDVVWVDYDAAVSMHRVLKVPERLKSLASPTPDDNRMSFGCINLPDTFYEHHLRPAADRGLVIYVLPETRPLKQTFASFYDVQAATRLAQY
jgi:hypothetical protein